MWLPEMVGLAEVLQQSPLSKITPPPLEVTLPPQVALTSVKPLTWEVVTLGAEVGMVETISLKLSITCCMLSMRALMLIIIAFIISFN